MPTLIEAMQRKLVIAKYIAPKEISQYTKSYPNERTANTKIGVEINLIQEDIQCTTACL